MVETASKIEIHPEKEMAGSQMVSEMRIISWAQKKVSKNESWRIKSNCYQVLCS